MISIDRIDKEYISSLVSAAVEENYFIDYKSELPKLQPNDSKKNFLKDLVAFANAGGGHIFYGIQENRASNNKPTGIPSGEMGLTIENYDALTLSLEQCARSAIFPTIPRLKFKEVSGFDDGSVFVIEVGKSFSRPHRVTVNASGFVIRTNTGNNPMGEMEIKNAFLGSESRAEKMREFRIGRFNRIQDLTASVPLSRRDFFVSVHIVPFSFQETVCDIGVFPAVIFSPFGKNGLGRFNIDGFEISASQNNKSFYGQAFRNGILEFVAQGFHFNEEQQVLRPTILRRDVINCLENMSSIYEEWEIDKEPLALFVSLGGFRSTLTINGNFDESKFLNRQYVLLPETLFTRDEDFASVVDRNLDTLWQGFGLRPGARFGDSDK